MSENLKPYGYIFKSPHFCPRKLGVVIPAPWHFKKNKFDPLEAKRAQTILFHELVHFHHMIGTVYGVYSNIMRLTQITTGLLGLKTAIACGERIKLPIINGSLLSNKDILEGFLDYMEQSIDYRLFKSVNPEDLMENGIELSVQEYDIYHEGKDTGEDMRVPNVPFYKANFKNNEEFSCPIGARAIMENYAKHLESVNFFIDRHQFVEESVEHFEYYFLSMHFLLSESVPDSVDRFKILCCLFYISLTGVEPIINRLDKEYFASPLNPLFNFTKTAGELKPPGLVFYNALSVALKIIKKDPRQTKDLDSFLAILCHEMEIPNIYDMNRQLKRLIDYYLNGGLLADICGNNPFVELHKEQVALLPDILKKTDALFPFIRYYLEMSSRFIDVILSDPVSFITGEMTMKTLNNLFSSNDKYVKGGFLGQYPVPNIIIEHTYDADGRIKSYTGMGDGGNEQYLLEVCLDIYDQIFSQDKIYCHGIRKFHWSSDANKLCKKAKMCDGKINDLIYNECADYHQSLLKMLLGDYESLI